MSNRISNFLHHLADACACEGEMTPQELQRLVNQELSTRKDINGLRADMRQMKEVIGFLGQQIKSLEASSDQDLAKIIHMEPKHNEI